MGTFCIDIEEGRCGIKVAYGGPRVDEDGIEWIKEEEWD